MGKHQKAHQLVYNMMRVIGGDMRTTVNLDEELLEDVKWLTGSDGTTQLVNAALKALVEREAARRLAKMGGTMPDLQPIPRRRSKPA